MITYYLRIIQLNCFYIKFNQIYFKVLTLLNISKMNKFYLV